MVHLSASAEEVVPRRRNCKVSRSRADLNVAVPAAGRVTMDEGWHPEVRFKPAFFRRTTEDLYGITIISVTCMRFAS